MNPNLTRNKNKLYLNKHGHLWKEFSKTPPKKYIGLNIQICLRRNITYGKNAKDKDAILSQKINPPDLGAESIIPRMRRINGTQFQAFWPTVPKAVSLSDSLHTTEQDLLENDNISISLENSRNPKSCLRQRLGCAYTIPWIKIQGWRY